MRLTLLLPLLLLVLLFPIVTTFAQDLEISNFRGDVENKCYNIVHVENSNISGGLCAMELVVKNSVLRGYYVVSDYVQTDRRTLIESLELKDGCGGILRGFVKAIYLKKEKVRGIVRIGDLTDVNMSLSFPPTEIVLYGENVNYTDLFLVGHPLSVEVSGGFVSGQFHRVTVKPTNLTTSLFVNADFIELLSPASGSSRANYVLLRYPTDLTYENGYVKVGSLKVATDKVIVDTAGNLTIRVSDNSLELEIYGGNVTVEGSLKRIFVGQRAAVNLNGHVSEADANGLLIVNGEKVKQIREEKGDESKPAVDPVAVFLLIVVALIIILSLRKSSLTIPLTISIPIIVLQLMHDMPLSLDAPLYVYHASQVWKNPTHLLNTGSPILTIMLSFFPSLDVVRTLIPIFSTFFLTTLWMVDRKLVLIGLTPLFFWQTGNFFAQTLSLSLANVFLARGEVKYLLGSVFIHPITVPIAIVYATKKDKKYGYTLSAVIIVVLVLLSLWRIFEANLPTIVMLLAIPEIASRLKFEDGVPSSFLVSAFIPSGGAEVVRLATISFFYVRKWKFLLPLFLIALLFPIPSPPSRDELECIARIVHEVDFPDAMIILPGDLFFYYPLLIERAIPLSGDDPRTPLGKVIIITENTMKIMCRNYRG